jgi:hypothetical protein
MRPLKIVIPPRAGHFSTLRLLASLQRRNSRFALKHSSLRALKLRGQGATKNLQCALPGSDFQVAQRSYIMIMGQTPTNYSVTVFEETLK